MRNTQQANSNRNNQLSNNERIINRTNQRRRKNRRKKIIIRSVLGVIFLCIGVVVALMLFFNINKITVTGDAVYSTEEVIRVSEVEIGDNLIFLSKSKLNQKISQELPYIDSVKIKRRLPSTLELVVTKTNAFMAISSEGYYTLLDKSGKVLECDLEIIGEDIVLANLGEIQSAVVGEKVVLKDERIAQKLQDVLTECYNVGIEHITSIDLSDIYNIKIVYAGRITLELGETNSENLNSKLALGKAAIDKQDEENNLYRGTINLTVEGTGFWSEEQSTTEPVTEEKPTENVGSEGAQNPENTEDQPPEPTVA